MSKPSAQFLKGATEAYAATAAEFDDLMDAHYGEIDDVEIDSLREAVEADYPYHANGESLPPWALIGPDDPEYPADTPWPANASEADYQAGWEWTRGWAPDADEAAAEFVEGWGG